MGQDILTHRITATGTGADDETRYKALAQNAAQQIAACLAAELPGFTYDSISFDGTNGYLPYRVKMTNSNWNCELIVSANAKYYYSSAFSSGYSFGLSFSFKLMQNGSTILSQSLGSGRYVVVSTAGNTVTASFDLKIYRNETAMFAVAFSYEYYDGIGFISLSFSSFIGSYDNEIYLGGRTETSTGRGIALPEEMEWYSQGTRRIISYGNYGSSFFPTEGYYLRPYFWFAYYPAHNCGVALFDGQYVLYQLWSTDGNSYVTTTPEATYTVDGQAVPATSKRMLILRTNPYRKMQKPGEVLTW